MSDGQRVVIYYQTQYDNSLPPNSPYGHYLSPLPLVQNATHLFLAAWHIHMEPVGLYLNDHLPENPWYDQMWKDIAEMQVQGIKVVGMLGGAAPGTYECLTADKFDTYYPVLAGYIKRYKLDGMDIDVEQDTDITVIIHLITQLKADFGADFIITLAPVSSALTDGPNLSGFSYIELEQKAGTNISWYNAQFYSGFGSFASDTEYLDIINYGKGLDPSRLVAGSISNPESGGGYVSPDEVASSAKALSAKFGSKFGGVFAWEYFHSNPDPSKPWMWAEMMKEAMGQGKEDERLEAMKRSRVYRADE